MEAILQKIPNHEETQNNFCFDKKKYTPKIPSVTTQQKPAAFQKSPPNKTHAVTVATQTSPKMHNMNQLENSPIPTNTHSFKQTDLTFQQSGNKNNRFSFNSRSHTFDIVNGQFDSDCFGIIIC